MESKKIVDFLNNECVELGWRDYSDFVDRQNTHNIVMMTIAFIKKFSKTNAEKYAKLEFSYNKLLEQVKNKEKIGT